MGEFLKKTETGNLVACIDAALVCFAAVLPDVACFAVAETDTDTTVEVVIVTALVTAAVLLPVHASARASTSCFTFTALVLVTFWFSVLLRVFRFRLSI